MKSIHDSAPSVTEIGVAVARLFELAVLLGDALDQGLTDRGLTRARAELLWRLQRRGAMTQRELSDDLRCTPRNVTGLVDALERGGLVERRPHPTDRRATMVNLTEAGSELTAMMDEDYQQTAGQLFDGFGLTEIDDFVVGMDRVLDRLRKPSRSSREP